MSGNFEIKQILDRIDTGVDNEALSFLIKFNSTISIRVLDAIRGGNKENIQKEVNDFLAITDKEQVLIYLSSLCVNQIRLKDDETKFRDMISCEEVIQAIQSVPLPKSMKEILTCNKDPIFQILRKLMKQHKTEIERKEIESSAARNILLAQEERQGKKKSMKNKTSKQKAENTQGKNKEGRLQSIYKQ